LDNHQIITRLFYASNSENKSSNKRQVSQKYLINILNYINFQDETILINFKHSKYDSIISIRARPQPSIGDTLDCLWIENTDLDKKLKSYEFLHFIIDDGQKLILVEPVLKGLSKEKISFILPETCYEVSSRKVKRYSCKDIQVEFIQKSAVFYGSLLDFNAISFRVEITALPPKSFQWINPEFPMTVVFRKEKEIFYTGDCRIIRQTLGQKIRTFVLEPKDYQIHRFKPKEIRSPRHLLSPLPNITFKHPIIEKTITLMADDISGSGFSVEEYHDHSVLLPGMIIPKLFIEFANDFKIRCEAQVIYRNIYVREEKMYAKCGIAILDMDIQDQVRLSSLLHTVTNKKSCVCNQVDLDALWKFLFETGFVYPEKYAAIYTNKEKFRETYEKLYIHNPNIARHFIYQDKGTIHGHISMVRFYENTWLFQHHAANRSHNDKAGLVVLNQIARYVNDFYCLYVTHMNFVICYFSQNNKFPERVFGGFTEKLNDPKGSSLDSFAYFQLSKDLKEWYFSRSWVLTKTQPKDLLELKSFYESRSGGLMTHALDLEPDMIDCDDLSREYQRIGFKRERYLFSLRKDDVLKAIIMVNISDTGLNMSNLTNCIHVIVLDSVDLPCIALYSNLFELFKYYGQDKIPILLYPVSYAESQSIQYEKIYNLWVISTQQTIHFLKHINNIFGRYFQNKNA
jgi:hypothetical protein